MEYQRKKKQILTNIQYNNLLGFSLIENKLERNFKSIVQALLLTQTQASQLKEDLKSLADSTVRQQFQTNDRLQSLQKKVQDLTSATKENKNNQQISSNQNIIQSIQQFKINVNTVKSQDLLPSALEINDQHQQLENNLHDQHLLLDNYQQLKDKINHLLQNQIDPFQLDKKINNIKDSINLLKAQIKTINDRQAKSKKRSSLFNNNNNNNLQTQATNNNNNSNNLKSNENDHQYLEQMNGIQQQLQKQINGIHIQINTLKLSVQQLKDSFNENRRKDTKINMMVEQVSRSQKRLQQKQKLSNQLNANQIKQLKSQIANLQTKPSQLQLSTLKKSKKAIEVKESNNIKQNISPNANQQINDRISKLQATIQGLLTQSQFQKFKNQTHEKFDHLQHDYQHIIKELKDQIQNLTQILDQKQLQIYGINQNIDLLKDKSNDISCQCQRKNHTTNSKYQQLKKHLQNLRDDLQFYKSMNQSSTNQHKIDLISQNTNINNDKKSTTQNVDNTKSQDLKKYFNRKIHDQRTYLLGLIRDLQKKLGNKNNFQQDFSTLWDKFGQINLFLQKKANEEDVRKNLSYLQKKLATLYQKICCSDENNQDARIAKTNWFCLSCDKNLHNYHGKIGQHIVWDTMPIKANHTKYYAKQDKKVLPTLKR